MQQILKLTSFIINVVFCRSLFVLFFLAIVLSVLFLLAIVLSVLFLLAIVLSVLFQFMDSDYPFDIFKLFLNSAIHWKQRGIEGTGCQLICGASKFKQTTGNDDDDDEYKYNKIWTNNISPYWFISKLTSSGNRL